MAEIAAIPKNGYRVVSTFSGCGGSCLGYRIAGFSVLWASEFELNAAECYKLNFPDCALDLRDIRAVAPEEILARIGMKAGELDLLDGSPPCQSFSTAGKRERHWGKVVAHGDGTAQRSDDLFFEYARILRGLMPKVFVAENVSGLVKGTAKGYFKAILAELKSCGYIVEARLLDAQWLGIPQMRQRIIFVGVRGDLAEKFSVRPEFPSPLPYRYSVRDAIGGIDAITGHNFGEINRPANRPFPTVAADCGQQPLLAASKRRYIEETGGQFSYGDFSTGPAPTVRAGGVGHLKVIIDGDISGQKIGNEWDKLKPGKRSTKYFQLSKADPNKPCPSITALGGNPGVAGVTHFAEKRKFTIAELKRICSFPDDFQLIGSYQKQWARLGKSVPPIMMRTIAEIIRDKILAKIS